MSFPSNTVCVVDTAVAADGEELLDILEEQPFGGAISLLYTRRPDAYGSFLKGGEEVEIVVGREQPGQTISGMGVCAVNTVFINEEPRKVGYLHGLRIRSDYRKRRWIQKGYQHLLRDPRRRRIALFFTTILEENLAARRLLEKRRPSMPIYEPWDRYLGFAVSTSRTSARAAGASWSFRPATNEDLEALVGFLNREGRRMHLFPLVTVPELVSATGRTPALGDFRLLLDREGEILAAGALWNQQEHKQYVVTGYKGLYRLIRPMSFAFPLVGIPRLPKRGSVLNFAALSFWAVKDNDPELFRRFLSGMRSAGAGYDFLFLGLSERHPLLGYLQRTPHHRYASLLYKVYYEHEKAALVQTDRTRIPFLEIGRL
jgi:hypothetical protein